MALVTFLKGINVGGYRNFRPSVLANELKKYDVVNIGAAGTFIFRKRVSRANLRAELFRHLPFEADAMICTGQQLIAAAAASPFDGTSDRSDIVRFMTLLAKMPRTCPSLPMRIPRHGRWIVKVLSVHDRFLFGLYRREMKAIGALAVLDELFGMPSTTRNWNTIRKVVTQLNMRQ